eukprot:scaffold493456_cov29-Prasinocladus_malaysianus.AAC.1
MSIADHCNVNSTGFPDDCHGGLVFFSIWPHVEGHHDSLPVPRMLPAPCILPVDCERVGGRSRIVTGSVGAPLCHRRCRRPATWHPLLSGHYSRLLV